MTGIGFDAWKELYRFLVHPVRHELPKSCSSLLTIIPHGPLFLLSFDALIDDRHQYLVESYQIHYAPAGAYLALKPDPRLPDADEGGILAVADPSRGPQTEPGKAYPSLPAARREAQAIRRLKPSAVQALSGPAATEEEVRARLADRSVLHLATHGILRSDDPMESFRVLGKTGDGEAEDGRLSAREIYHFKLEARLVVLSGCRSGAGQVSSDGIIGLTRAFFYAGAPAILATVGDVPTSRRRGRSKNSTPPTCGQITPPGRCARPS